jgi:pullulanase
MFSAKIASGSTGDEALARARAQWIDVGLLAWDADVESCEIVCSDEAGLRIGMDGLIGGVQVRLSECSDDVGVGDRFPHLSGFRLWQVPQMVRQRLVHMLTCALAVQGRDADGEVCAVSGIQIAGVLDSLYAGIARASLREMPLGVHHRDGRPWISVWAPTAQAVVLLLHVNGIEQSPQRFAMRRDEPTGIWRIEGEASWEQMFYRFEVSVHMNAVSGLVRNIVTDPYSVSLSMNSRFSQVIDTRDPQWKPDGWDDMYKPGPESPVDAVIYELHVRDFSIYDTSVPAEDRGRFRAFTHRDSLGMRHLQRLADAGMTHVELMPTFDFATVDEDPARRTELDPAALALLPPDSEAQTTVIRALTATDGYNWGYDPFHYNVPEGSYATNLHGPQRVREFREMVAALAHGGMHVVLDVVFNHTFASGMSEKSVLDKVVPGYYHRRNLDGDIERSTCCENTASEHAMMEQLIVDSVCFWAVHYKVDGFRFDLMGHHMLRNMHAVRAALDELTPLRDGVNGRRLLLHGEGWSFGEVQDNARGRNASQRNLGGSGIGSFNDRLRDAVRGGSPFSDPRAEGFASGMFYESGIASASASLQRSQLETSDWLRLALAGTLSTYELQTLMGVHRGDQILYRGQPAGYAYEPGEVINYVGAHDNETLFDKIQWAAPDEADIEKRVRMHLLALSLVVFAQGVPFFHAGDELLRSKSLDANSYNSSDWFNAIDWTLANNGWGRGLPPSVPQHWEEARTLLRNPALRSSPAHAEFVRDVFCDMLRIRRECELFRLRTADAIRQRVRFCNCGPEQIPGVIVMRIDDVQGAYPVLAAWNASGSDRQVYVPLAVGVPLALHPLLRRSADVIVRSSSFDSVTGMLQIPGLTAAIFC